LLGPPLFAAACLPLLLLLLALAVPSASRPPDVMSTRAPAEGFGEAAPGAQVGPTAAVSSTAPHAPKPPTCSPLASRGPAGGPPASASVKGVLNKNGELTARRLEVGTRGGRKVAVSLPTDSFAAEPANGWLLYGVATGGGSEVRGVDLESGCDARLARLAGIARGAVLAADGGTLFVHAVDAATRADLGVVRFELATGAATPALAAFEGGAGFGPVFATTLAWASDGSTLVVQSCGAESCQTRTLDTRSGVVTTFAEPHGALVGATASALYVFEAGHERPAALLAIARDDGTLSVVAEQALDARFDGAAATLSYETAAGWQEVQP
jgi:hypothetical protein